MSKYAGILRGIQYTDDRNRLAQEREDRLKELEYNRNRQATQDSQQAQLFEMQMKEFKQKEIVRQRENAAYGFHQAIVNKDFELFQKTWKKANLDKLTPYDTVLPVSADDRDIMIQQGIIKPEYDGDITQRFIKAPVKDESGVVKYKYMTMDSVASSVAGKELTALQQKQITDALTRKQAMLGLQKTQSEINKNVAATKKTESELNEDGKDPTKVVKIIEANQKIKANEVYQKVIKGEIVDVNTPDYSAALKGELSNIKNSKVQEEIDTLNKMTQRVQRANTILEKINSTDDQSFYEMLKFSLSKMKNVVTSYSDADYADQATKTDNPAIMQSYLERIGLDSSLAGYLADLIKEQSGAAVNEAEVQRKALELIGGNKYLVNKQTMQKAFSTHIEDVRGKIERATNNSLYKQVAPLAYNKMSHILSFTKGTKTKTERPPLSSFRIGGN